MEMILKPCRLSIKSALKSGNHKLKCVVLTSATGDTAVSRAREFPVVFSVPARRYLVFRNVRWVPVTTCSFMPFLRRPSAILIIPCPNSHCDTYRKQGSDVQMSYRLLELPSDRFHVVFTVIVRRRVGLWVSS